MRRLVFNTGGPDGARTFVCAATASASASVRVMARLVRCYSVPVGCRHRPAMPPTRGPAAVRSAISGPAVWAEFRGRGRDGRNSRDCRCFSKNATNGSLWLALAHVFGTCPMSHDGPRRQGAASWGMSHMSNSGSKMQDILGHVRHSSYCPTPGGVGPGPYHA